MSKKSLAYENGYNACKAKLALWDCNPYRRTDANYAEFVSGWTAASEEMEEQLTK